MIEGVGKDAETVYNDKGAAQSNSSYRFDLLDTDVLFAVTKVLKEGADKYGDTNWHNISVEDHLNHMFIHAYAYLHGDTQDAHLSHMVCRAMFALGVAAKERKQDVEDFHMQKGKYAQYPYWDFPRERLWLSETKFVTYEEITRQTSPHVVGEEWRKPIESTERQSED